MIIIEIIAINFIIIMMTTNGASLEDCLTNIFSLVDLNGLRWKRFRSKESQQHQQQQQHHPNHHHNHHQQGNNNHHNHHHQFNNSYTPIDTHPILTTYAKCIEENHIAVWRHEPQKRHGSNHGGHQTSGHSNFPTPTRTSNNNTPTNAGSTNQLNNAGNSTSNNSNNYELWIFGYGNQLKVDNVIGDDLVEFEDENWESKGMSYECRTLLFKALHNLIERCLITKGFARIGRWFVQPLPENLMQSSLSAASTNTYNSNSPLNRHSRHSKQTEQNSITSSSNATNLSSTISSTINKIIEGKKELYDSRQGFDKSDGLRHTSIRSSSNYFTTSLEGLKSSLSFAFSFFIHGDSNVCATVDVRQQPLIHPLTKADLSTFQEGGIVRVALAPYGLNGILNGISYKDSDNGTATTEFIQQWSKIYPLPKTLARLVPENGAIYSSANFNNQKTSITSTPSNQFNESGSRAYMSNLTNVLLPSSHQNKPCMYFNYEPNEVPPVVEVIVAGYRMRYPSECVFITSKVIDLYKSLNAPAVSRINSSSKRPNKNSNPTKLNKLSASNEKINEEKIESLHDQATKVKIEPTEQTKAQSNFTSPFKLSSTIDSNNKSTSKIEGASAITYTLKQPSINNDKGNGCMDNSELSNNLSNNQTILRYNSSKVGFGANHLTSLGPTDIGKIYPTPPSLEQIVASPSNLNEEAATKDASTTSPANQIDLTRDNGIDVYKPVECALMPPPPKWAALTNIIISSSKSLPPECVYKGSSLNTSNAKTIINRFSEFKGNLSKQTTNSNKQFTSLIAKSNNSIASPLTDQTNKNGYNRPNQTILLNCKPPLPITNSATSSTTNYNFNSTSISANTLSTTAIPSFTLPHQRLFNNLHELNSVQLNLLLSDSVLGMFKDHNFESCALCVCNMSIKGTLTDTIPKKIDNSTSNWRSSVGGSDNLLSSSSLSNENANECTCGFSAITNRHNSHLAGLFLEDELEVTNVLYDPTEMIDQNKLFRKLRLSNYSENSYTDEQKIMTKLSSDAGKVSKNLDDNSKAGMKSDKPSKDDKSSQSSPIALQETRIFVIDQLKQQCSTMIHSNSSLSKVLLIESFRNNRHLTSCSNYYAQITPLKTGSNGPFYRFLDDTNKYTTVKMMNRNPISLKFSDFCEITKNIIQKLGNQSQINTRVGNNKMMSLGSGSSTTTGLTSIISRLFSPNRQSSMMTKSGDNYTNNRSNLFIQGLQALVLPTLSIDPKGALQMLEYLIKEESKEALATLNKAILIFTSPMHDWQFLGAPTPENNFDVTNLLKIIQPSLDESIGSHNKLYKDFVFRQKETNYLEQDDVKEGRPVAPPPPCQGPLTWREFHQAAGRGTEDQCEPQPIPTLLVGHHVEKNHLAVSPFALRFWDKLLLEPYAPGHNLFYMVIAPDNQNLLSHINQFFKELSNTYELLKLGKHTPIGNGLVLANLNQTEHSNINQHEWFSKISFNDKDLSETIVSRLKSYAAKMNSNLTKTIVDFMEERQPPYDPHADRFNSSPSPQTSSSSSNIRVQQPVTAVRPDNSQPSANRTFSNFLGLSSSAKSCQPQDMYGYSTDNQSISSEMNNQLKSQSLIGGAGPHGSTEDNVHLEDEANKQSGIVIYIIDPFSSPSITQNHRALAIIGLFKCYSLLLDSLPENVRRITQVQLLSLDSIVSHSRPIIDISRMDQLKSLSMNIYSRCKRILTNQMTAKSLTGFGPAAALESFFKTKNPDFCITKMFAPPFILAPMKDKQTELGEMFGDRREKSSVLFCSYCITEDRRWLLASVTNEKGEMSETTVININIIDRMKKPAASVRRIALRKLMDFILTVMSDWMNPFRLIIGKMGRVGQGELKEWASLMSKRSLLNYSRHLNERCHQCTVLPPQETVSILSACLVSLEPDSKLRIMPDQLMPIKPSPSSDVDERQASFNKCPLNTPEDASATHILVFPTSASIQSSHSNIEELVGTGLDDDLLDQFPALDGDDLELEGGINDLFGNWDNSGNVSDNMNTHNDSIMSTSNIQVGSGSVGDNANNQDEILQLLQQPLALGYIISTAKIGQMPNWFWSTSPHLRHSCPTFLKSALHIHMPCVHLSDDLLHSGVGHNRKSHQLDSNLTTDVLRYVLEGYNSLSWLALNPKTYDRQSCLPVHMQNLLQLYHLMESFS